MKISESLFVNYLFKSLLNFVLNGEMFVAGRTCFFFGSLHCFVVPNTSLSIVLAGFAF